MKKNDSHSKLQFPAASIPIQKAEKIAHSEIRNAEQENTGVEAGHMGEFLTESALRFSGHQMQRYHQEALHHKTPQNNSGGASNAATRHLQKQQIKRNYAKHARQAEQTASQTKKTAEKAAETARAVVLYLKKHSRIALVIVGLAASVALLLGGLSSCAMMVGSGIGGMFTASYETEDPVLLEVEAAYCAMEADLQAEIDAIETFYPDYDGYEYELDDIGHDPYVLISMLSALHGGAFALEEIEADLAMIFSSQYTLTLTERTRVIVESGVIATENILCVTLENIGMDRLPAILLTEEQLSSYAAYMSTLGNREELFAGVPGASTLTSPTYYDIPPEALEDETFAAMVAEGEKYLGYPYVWGGSAPATSFDCSGFVCWVINHSGWSVGRTTAQGLYNICTPVSSSRAKPGDLIFFVGTYDTPEVSHVGIYVGGGQMLHCGDPISYANVNVPYWQAHFYCFGRLP